MAMTDQRPEQSQDQVDRAMTALREAQVPPGPDEAALQRTLAKMQAAAEGRHRPGILERIRSMNRWKKLAVAATALLSCGLLAALMFRGQEGVALAQVREKLDNARTYRARVTVAVPGSDKPMIWTVLFKDGDRMRQELPNGVVTIWDFRKLKGLVLSTRNKKAQWIEFANLPKELQDEIRKEQQMNFLEEIRKLLDGKTKELGTKTLRGRKCKGYRAEKDEAVMEIWVDAKTAEPVLVEMDNPVMPGKLTISDFELNAKLDDALFALRVPKGYQVEKMSKVDFNVTDAQLVEGLRVLVAQNENRFPVYPTMTPELIKRMGKAGHSKEDVKKMAAAIQKAVIYLATLGARTEEWKYVGKDVKLGDAKAVVLWWRLKGAKTYRVLFGDLKIRDLTPEAWKKLLKAPPAGKPDPKGAKRPARAA